MPHEMRVHVAGCVEAAGLVDLAVDSTVELALAAAGGIGRAGVEPSGVVTIRSRRKADGRYYKRRVLNIRRHPGHLQIMLRDQDVIVVQFNVEAAAGRTGGR